MNHNHAKVAKEFIKDQERVQWHDQALWYVREKRDYMSQQVPEWENLRDLSCQIKQHTLSHLDQYLETFEANAQANGFQVHWAADAQEHNQIILEILQNHNICKLIKSKSMLTEDCHLNPYLQKNNIEVIESDLGERIIQLAGEDPSHIVLPAIHKKKEEVGDLFQNMLGTEKGNNDPTYLTKAARRHLREHFLTTEAALTGVNFAVAETGGFVVCTNEGNADMGAQLAKVHIATMGIEKVIPRQKDLGVFLRLLARSATGQPITTYSSHFYKPQDGQEVHIIITDAGRTDILSKSKFRNALQCIRCGACLNTCPVYRRSGGHSYGSTIPGPIGSILSPNKSMKHYKSLVFASSLCGSCTDVCPAKINIAEQLYLWRQEIQKSKAGSWLKTFLSNGMKWAMVNPKRLAFLGSAGRWCLNHLPSFLINNAVNPWTQSRTLSDAPRQSFKQWYRENRTHEQ